MNLYVRSVWANLRFVLLLLCFLPLSVGESQHKLPRVLILNEVGTTYPGITLIDQGIRDGLDTSPDKLETYREYMDTILFPDPADQERIRELYIRKYSDRKPDVIITVGPSPLKFMVEAHTKFFPGVPIVFCMPSWVPGNPTLSSGFTGVGNDAAVTDTIEAALRLQPTTQNIVVVGGMSYIDREYLLVHKEQLRTYERNYHISYLTDLVMSDLVERLKHLPNHTIVIYGSFSEDAAGARFTSAGASAIVTAAANAPVFILADVEFGYGQVGGKLSSLREMGRVAGSLAQRLLNGEKPQAIPVAKSPTVYMFDWRALKRWGFKESDLPPGSIVLNREFTVWESYQWYIVSGISLILLEAFLISGLLWQHARRREASRALEQRTTESQAREELLKIFVKNVPAGVAMLDREMRYLQVSDRWCADYGVDASQVLGRSHYKVFPDMPDRWREIHRRALGGETLRADEDHWDRESGTTWVCWEVRPWQNVDAEPGGILIFAEDITRRKQADEALSGISRKLIESQEQERSRIGRELHDDINQRLALLAVELDRFKQSGSKNGSDDIVEDCKRRVMEIAGDVQGLSHRLHSSKLEYLGLAAAAKSFCREISEMHHVRIEFTQNGVPRKLPKDVALCLFRVLQEALQNAVKYSGTDHFEVALCGTSADIKLKVRDFGRGFSVDDATGTKGLGLVSMRERVNLVKGEFVIKSNSATGTEIIVHVPASTADYASKVISGAA